MTDSPSAIRMMPPWRSAKCAALSVKRRSRLRTVVFDRVWPSERRSFSRSVKKVNPLETTQAFVVLDLSVP
jgi:hypothetical protein